jgi:hypothetical protein
MGFRLGLGIGFAAGYYLGAKAGTERYDQINRWIDRTRQSEAYGNVTEKARAVADLGVERARDLVQGGNGEEPAEPTTSDRPLTERY